MGTYRHLEYMLANSIEELWSLVEVNGGEGSSARVRCGHRAELLRGD